MWLPLSPLGGVPEEEVLNDRSSLSAEQRLLIDQLSIPTVTGALVQLHGLSNECTSGKKLPYQASLCLTIPPSLLTSPLLGQPGFPVQLSYIAFQLIINPSSIDKLPLLMNHTFPTLSEDRSVRKGPVGCRNYWKSRVKFVAKARM